MPETAIQTDPMPELEELLQLRKDFIWLKANSRMIIRPNVKSKKKMTPEEKAFEEENRRLVVAQIVKLGFMPYKYFDNVLSDKEGDVWDRQHKDRRRVTAKLCAISKRMSAAYFEKYNDLPPLYGPCRSNYYTEQDMKDFGIEVIREFMWEYPIDKWTKKSTWDCGMEQKRVALTKKDLQKLCFPSGVGV